MTQNCVSLKLLGKVVVVDLARGFSPSTNLKGSNPNGVGKLEGQGFYVQLLAAVR